MLDTRLTEAQFAKYQPILYGLDSGGAAATPHAATSAAVSQLQAVRLVKNAVIGNRTKKALFMHLGVIPKLVSLLADGTCSIDVKTQAAIVLGSFGYGTGPNIEALVQSGAIGPLLHSLASADLKLAEASARALKALFQQPSVPRSDLFRGGHVNTIVRMLSLPEEMVAGSATSTATNTATTLAELCASILARCCQTAEAQQQFAAADCIPPLVRCLQTAHPRLQEAALDALAELAHENAELSKVIVGNQLFGTVLHKHLHDKRSSMRLVAATFLTNVYRANAVVDGQELRVHLLPVLVKLFDDSAVQVRQKACLVLAYLVSDCEEMQTAAADTDSIARIAALLTSASASSSGESPDAASAGDTITQSTTSDRLMESGLLALAALCSQKDECRKMVFDAKILPQLLQALAHGNTKVRLAACQCTRSLSRSAKSLRTSLIDAGVALPLVKLLADESTAVQATAAATLCNIVLDFSPMKSSVLEHGGVEKLASLVLSMDSGLRLNAVWALKNLLFQADTDIKHKVMAALTYPTLENLIQDSDTSIQEQAVNLLRNLACGKESDIQDVFDAIGDQKLMAYLDEKLASDNNDIVIQALYVIVNVSTGSERHKNAIMSNDNVLAHILRCMTSTAQTDNSIRTATVWCVINLTWPDDSGSEQRVRRLRALHYEEQLRQLVDSGDIDTDLRDRVRTALQHFQLDPTVSGSRGVTAPAGSASNTADGSQH